MTITRPRLTAAFLCLLLALAIGFILYNGGRSGPPYLRHSADALSSYDVAADPMPPPALVGGPPTLVREEPTAVARFQAPEPGGGGGPAVSPTAAPGVAFNYHYAFRLPAARIAEVQERHAALCERLTVARCRIIGMLYRVVDDRNIEAQLALKLDPGIARFFGRTGVAAVVRADGMLTESEIEGVDAGGAIRDAGRSLAEAIAELERIEARLRAAGTRPDERPQLDFQAQQLRERIRALSDSRDVQQDSLATTPMLFDYGSGEAASARADQPGLAQALRRAIDNFLAGMTILAIILVTLLPWALSAAAIWALARFARRRWFPPAPEIESRPDPGG